MDDVSQMRRASRHITSHGMAWYWSCISYLQLRTYGVQVKIYTGKYLWTGFEDNIERYRYVMY